MEKLYKVNANFCRLTNQKFLKIALESHKFYFVTRSHNFAIFVDLIAREPYILCIHKQNPIYMRI